METVADVLGTCRLPYTLQKDGKSQEKGYLLSSKDVCTLDVIPELINSGVKSFKIEGRMKSKEYVGVVTNIYRKYIDLAESNKNYVVDEKDREKLMQIFNRGGFSTGYLKGKLGKDMMYTKKPNHMGVLVGKVISYNSNKGRVRLKLLRDLNLGDSIAIEDSSCKVSELMIENNNTKSADKGQVVTIGRIKGKIDVGNKVYKTVSTKLNKEISIISSKENIKRPLKAKIYLNVNKKIKLEIEDLLSGIKIEQTQDVIIKIADKGISIQRIKEQLSKTGNTPFEIKQIECIKDDNIIISISDLNNIRRKALEKLEYKIIQSFKRNKKAIAVNREILEDKYKTGINLSILLNRINKQINYCNLKGIDNVYIPFKEFLLNKEIVNSICKSFDTYVYFPAITKGNYEKLIKENLETIFTKGIKGVVISNLSQLDILPKDKKFKIIANYTLNIANNNTIQELEKFGISKYIISPESDKKEIISLANCLGKEAIVYGRTLLMTTEYCTIGTFKDCNKMCEKGIYTLRDRMGFEFPIYTDRVNCNNLIYNSKTTSISWKDLNVNSIRIDILEETEKEIQSIIDIHKKGNRLEGEKYTNGNLNREI